MWAGGKASHGVMAMTLVLLSGAVMFVAGVLAHMESWTLAGPVTLAGGVLILPAFAAARSATARPAHAIRPPRVPTLAATLASGAIMVLAGYSASAWAWWVGALLAPLGGLVIMAAFVFELDAADRES